MPRPLIIKVDDHKLQPNKKAIGSINVQVLKETAFKNTHETHNLDNYNGSSEFDATDISQYGTSIVRSLINKYESSTVTSNLAKFKSKSLADLPKTQTSVVTKASQDDLLYNRNIYSNNEFEKFDFKKVFSKFEDPGHLNKRSWSSHLKNELNENNNIADIKQKAKLLLENRHFQTNYSLWQDQVIQLLQQIENLGSSSQMPPHSSLEKREYHYLVSKNEDELYATNHSFEKKFADDGTAKVKHIRNIFEEKTDSKRSFLRTNSASYSPYLGVKDEEHVINDDYRQLRSSMSIQQLKYFNGESYDVQTENQGFGDVYNVGNHSYEVADEVDNVKNTDYDAVLQLEHSGKVDELKSYFESEPAKYVPYDDFLNQDKNNLVEEGTTKSNTLGLEENVHVVDNRILPPPKIFNLDEDFDSKDVNATLKNIKELTEHLENYEQEIDNITDKNKEEGSYINEELVKILIKLDEITTYGHKSILMARKNAIQYVQNCIQKLKDKVGV